MNLHSNAALHRGLLPVDLPGCIRNLLLATTHFFLMRPIALADPSTGEMIDESDESIGREPLRSSRVKKSLKFMKPSGTGLCTSSRSTL